MKTITIINIKRTYNNDINNNNNNKNNDIN